MRSKNRLRRKKRGLNESLMPKVSFTSLMDVVTNILVYVIKIFAVSAITVQNPAVFLPKSNSQQEATNAVVVMITGKHRMEAEDDETEIHEETPAILVDDRVIQEIDPKTYRVPANAKQKGYIINSLKRELAEVRREQIATQKFSEGESKGFNAQVIIVADKDTPYRVLADVLVTCGEVGFGSFQFVIVKREA